MYKGIIFDFDGVIVKSNNIKSEAFANLYMEHGEEVVNKVIRHHQSNLGISRFEKIKFYHNNFLNKNITNEKIKKIANKFSNLVFDKVTLAPYIPGVLDFIKKNYGLTKLFISTATPTEEIEKILINRKIKHYFNGIYGSPESKILHIRKIKKKYKMNSKEIIFYGDGSSDLNAAIDTDVNFVLIKNSFNENLRESFKGEIINNFVELL